MAKKKKKKKKAITLSSDELQLLSQVLYQSRWSGREWQQKITPLINKIAKMIDQTE